MIVVPRSKRGTESNGIAAKYSDGEVVRIYGPRQGQSRWFDTTRVCFSTASVSRPSAGATVGLLSAKGGCRRRVDGTAGLPSAPEMPYAPRQLRLVPDSDTRSRLKCAPTVTPLRFPYRRSAHLYTHYGQDRSFLQHASPQLARLVRHALNRGNVLEGPLRDRTAEGGNPACQGQVSTQLRRSPIVPARSL
jgi:hypothetical protein